MLRMHHKLKPNCSILLEAFKVYQGSHMFFEVGVIQLQDVVVLKVRWNQFLGSISLDQSPHREVLKRPRLTDINLDRQYDSQRKQQTRHVVRDCDVVLGVTGFT
jgi:hypothetical protein